jgi:alpha,alpha-trehalase
MHKNEIIMNQFFTTIGNNDKAYDYAKKAKERLDSLNELLYVNGSWMDFDLESMAPARNRNFISDIFPLLFIDSIEINKVAAALQKVENLLFKYPGGIPANEHISGQQWDFPNVWAPIQQLSIQLFLRLDNSEHGENYTKALNIAQRWINSTFCGYEMFSKILKIVIMIYK